MRKLRSPKSYIWRKFDLIKFTYFWHQL